MKKLTLSLLALSFCYCGFAQIKTYSVSDANQDETVDISDVNKVISKITGSDASEQQVVNADDLNSLLKSIDSRLAAIEEKLGIGGEQKDTTVTPTPDPTDTHEYVDLGLPSGTLWAITNVGADNPEDAGLYFAWGETTGYTSDTSDGRSFDWENYRLCNGSAFKMTKYSPNASYWDWSLGTSPDEKLKLESIDDAASVNWGTNWCMPTHIQQEELVDTSYTTSTWTTQNGVNGRLITSKSNGNSIFLPAAGYRDSTNLYHVSARGYYWSSERDPDNSFIESAIYAFLLTFQKGSVWTNNLIWRYEGFSVRPVRSASKN